MAKDNVTRRVSIYVNGKEVENSLKGVEGAMAQVRNRLRLLNKDSETYDQDSKELTTTMANLKVKQAEYRQELGLTNNTMKDAKEISGGLRGALSGIYSSLTSGDLSGAKQGILELKAGMGGLLKSTLAFIASPIGLAIAALAGLVVGAKYLFDFNKKLEVSNKELRALGVSASEIGKVRDEIQATASTFDKEFSEIAQKAKSLSETYKISMSEANDIIAQGLANGGAQNSEFLSSLGEYDEFFAKAGYSAQEFVDIINTGYDLGIYTDKLPDALKEADLSLKEQTKTTRDALVNAFGASFTDDILLRIRTGQTTTKQALEEIAIKSKESNLSQQQYAQLTADVFKGAGEDAGGAAKIFDVLEQSSTRALSETAKGQLALQEATEKYNKAQSKLFEIEGFGDIWTGIKVSATESMTSILDYISDLKEDIQPLIDLVGVVFSNAWEYTKATVVTAFELIGGILKAFSNGIKTVIDVVTKLFQGDFSGAIDAVKKGFLNLGSIVFETFGKIQNKIIDTIKAIVDNVGPLLEALGFDIEKIKKTLDSFKNKEVELKVKTEEAEAIKKKEAENTALIKAELEKQRLAKEEADKKEADKRQKAYEKRKALEEKEARESYKLAKELADAKARLAKAQLDQYLFEIKENLNKEKQLTPEILAAEEDKLDTIRNAQIEFNNQELERKKADLIAKAELEGTSQEVLNANLEALNIEYYLKNQELDLEFQRRTQELKNNFELQEKERKAEQLIADKEIELINAENEFEERRIRIDQQYEREYADLVERKRKGFITEQQFAFLSKDLDEKTAQAKIQIARAERDAKLAEYGVLFSNIAKLLGENTAAGKAAALATVAISQGLAVARIWEQESTLPSPFDVISKVAGTAVAVANVLSAAKKINSVKTPKFFYGGATGTKPALGNDEYGPVTGYVHKNEYVIPEVMTQDPQFADTISWLENNRQRKLRGFVDGGEVSSGVVQDNSNQPLNDSAMLFQAINQLNSILSSGIMAKLNIGYQDVKALNEMSEEINQSTQNGTVS
ncbi:hypothetical protein LXD69_10260 [Flavobacterium sediminilitoris]|uniref:Phage tail tape measure protein domain-containing protein n=1 Tax=Flavobacterium sediminilitoris TaxID=2024526 RepID=A0ABY4HIS5_9FLAO|nr:MULTISPECIES: phage tail tape measure protein [Flavobacterium]UOX32435.1 hypothetical protein LXD69_10260 [Flavobacterium sediminilitoris]